MSAPHRNSELQQDNKIVQRHWITPRQGFVATTGKQHRDHLRGTDSYEEEYTDQHVGLVYAQYRIAIASWDNNHYQYTSGFMTEEAWQMYADRLRRGCGANGTIRAIMENHSDSLRRSFVEYCLQLADD